MAHFFNVTCTKQLTEWGVRFLTTSSRNSHRKFCDCQTRISESFKICNYIFQNSEIGIRTVSQFDSYSPTLFTVQSFRIA